MLRRTQRGGKVALIVTPQYLPMLGGMERECALLATEFHRRGFEPVVITEQLDLPVPRSERSGPVLIHRIPSSSLRTLPVQLKVAARLALLVLLYRRRAAFVIVRTATLPSLVVGVLKRLRLLQAPTLVTAETGGGTDDVVALARRPLFRISRWLVAANDCLNGLCQANVDHLRLHGFPESKITTIPNGVDTSAWHSTAAPTRVRRFLFLGRLHAEKGLFELVDAFSRVVGNTTEVSLTIAGAGPALDDLRARSSELNLGESVSFAGLVPYDQVSDYFATHECLVLPSHSEGMPLSVLEAASHHRLLIVTDVGDIHRLFGDRIRICAPGDTAALAEMMQAAIDDPHPVTDYQDVIDLVAIEAVAEAMLARLDVELRFP